MYADKCVLKGKTGIAWLDRKGEYAVIVNKTLHQHGIPSRFAVVNTAALFVDSVYGSRQAAAAYIKKKAKPAREQL